LVQTALIRCYRAWGRVSKASDTDAYVYQVLVNCWSKSRKRHWWGEEPASNVPATVGLLSLSQTWVFSSSAHSPLVTRWYHTKHQI